MSTLDISLFPCAIFATFIAALFGIQRVLSVPPHLQHLPRAPIFPLLLSYASGEAEERRIRRILLPSAVKHRSGLILVWVFGTWAIHCLDYKIGKTAMENRLLTKQPPPEHMLFWRFTGKSNIFFIEGDQWKTRSKPVRASLNRAMPIPQFVSLAKRLFLKLGTGGRVRWSNLTHRFSLDAIGTTVLGYDFKALDNHHSPFVSQYQRVMHEIANPLYIFLPLLEVWVPRKEVIKDMETLIEQFRNLLAVKRTTPGSDIISYMLEEPDMSDVEHRDNMVVLFMAGHDTTAGALSTLVYCFARHPEIQRRARQEVLGVIGNATPAPENLSNLHYLQACIREAMRFNNPSTTNIPRFSSAPVRLDGYDIPPNTPIILNMYGIMHNAALWPEPDRFDPSRFLDGRAPDEQGWVPFGLGPRQCPARAFALNEQRTLMSMLLREYEWSMPDDSIHVPEIRNEFSAFALNLPYHMDIIFRKLD